MTEPKAYRIQMTRQHDDVQEMDDGVRFKVLRASVGGNEQVGFYLTFRGDPNKVVEMLEMMTEAAKQMLPAGRYKDER